MNPLVNSAAETTPAVVTAKESSRRTRNRLGAASIICACFVIMQMTGAHMSGSLAIWSDAIHKITDLIALLISMMASHLALKPPSKKFTYGFSRIESLTALFSVFTLVLVTLWLMYDSVLRFYCIVLKIEEGKYADDELTIDGKLMSITAGLGIFLNLVLALVLRENHVHLPGAACDHLHPSGYKCAHEVFDAPGGGHGASPTISLKFGDTEMSSIICRACPDTESSSSDDDDEEDESILDVEAEPTGRWSKFLRREKRELIPQQPRSSRISTLRAKMKEAKMKAKSSILTTGNINLDAALLHTLTDLLENLVLLITACVIWWKPEWYFLDPVLTFIFSWFVIWQAIPIMKRSTSVLLDVRPQGLSYDKIRDALIGLPNVHSICALQIWSVSDGDIGLSCHVCVSVGSGKNRANKTAFVLKRVMITLKEEFGISGRYVTIQIYAKDRNRYCPSCGTESAVAPLKAANIVIV